MLSPAPEEVRNVCWGVLEDILEEEEVRVWQVEQDHSPLYLQPHCTPAPC